jgi:hypothetical protein
MKNNMKKSTVALIGILVHLAVSANGAVINYHSFDSDFKDGVGSNDLTVGGTSVAAPTISNTVGDSVFGSGAANFSTTDDWLATTMAITFSSTDAWSVSFWAARDTDSNANQGMVIGDVTDSRDFIWLNENASQGNGFRFRSASNANTNIATTPFDHGFHHWVLVADGTGSLKVYRDNAIVSTSSTNTSFDINAVGRAYTSSAYSMYGQIDELYIYDEAISATKVGQLFIDNTGPDETPPTLDGGSDIADNRAGGPVTANSLVTYAVTFSEDMDDTTVDASDFGNAGTAPVEFGAVVETAPGVFSVPLTPTSTGTLQLQVNQSAVLSDPAGNDLGTSSAILDDTSITVESTDTTAPGITGSEMVDNQSGSPVIVDSLITYTLTFSEGINASTVDASDFGNAGTATVEFGAVVETAPGVFSVEVTPTSAGTLQLQILASAVITDLTGNPLDTSSAILADGIITVEAGFNPSAVERVRVFLVGGYRWFRDERGQPPLRYRRTAADWKGRCHRALGILSVYKPASDRGIGKRQP